MSRIEADSIRLSRYEMDKSRPTQYRTLTREEVSALDRQVRRNIWVRELEVWGEKKTRVLSPWRSRPIWVVLLPSQKKILVQQTSPHRWTVMSRQDAQQNGISSDLIAELFPDDVISSP